jgi:5-methyltetrahydrofolate--homocysteine methyltransferase
VNADAIGLSGLLVKSTVVMREDLEELNIRELFHYPVLLGGAALTRKYVETELREVYRGNVYYCQDAFEGLATLNKVMPALKAGTPLPELTRTGGKQRSTEDGGYDEVRVTSPSATTPASGATRSDVKPALSIPKPPFWGSRVVKGLPLRDIFPYVNEIALFRGQWQYQKGQRSDGEYAEFVENEVRPVFRRWQEQAIAKHLLVPQAVYGYFPAQSDGNDLLAWPGFEDGKPVGEPVRFHFPRQPGGRHLCIADFFLPKESGRYDTLALSLVTMGSKASEFAQELFKGNEYREYLHFHGFAVESAEALAEYWHKRVREELGIAAADGATTRELFAQGYQGSRYAFGYPACPDLEEQVGLAKLLDPSRIGCELSETFQWHPEQSTSAVIVHHPEARYFVIK